MNAYIFSEPTIGAKLTNVTLIKEDNRPTEQTFGFRLVFGDTIEVRSATLQIEGSLHGFDYVITAPGSTEFFTLLSPDEDRVEIPFIIFPDDLVEGTEGFRIDLTTLGGTVFPNFALPSAENSPFPFTEIRIADTDGKSNNISYFSDGD